MGADLIEQQRAVDKLLQDLGVSLTVVSAIGTFPISSVGSKHGFLCVTIKMEEVDSGDCVNVGLESYISRDADGSLFCYLTPSQEFVTLYPSLDKLLFLPDNGWASPRELALH